MNDNRNIVIDRATWRCGGDHGGIPYTFGRTLMLNQQGYKCCLGFAALQRGAPEEHILNRSTPGICAVLKDDLLLRAPCGSSSMFASAAMKINDDPDLSNTEREQKLIQHGQAQIPPVNFTFIGEYPKEAPNVG